MKAPKCPDCESGNIEIRRLMEETCVFKIIDALGGKHLDEERTGLHYIGSPEVRCWSCNKSYTIKEFLESQ